MTDPIEIRQLHGVHEITEMLTFDENLWQLTKGSLLEDVIHCVTLADAGNGFFAAYVNGAIAGTAEAAFGRRDNAPIVELVALGVSRELNGRGIATAMLQHIRQWALNNDVNRITFHFDPLVSTNAHLYLRKINGVIRSYEREIFGPMRGINAEDATDRVLVTWDLASKPSDLIPIDSAQVMLRSMANGAPKLEALQSDLVCVEIPRDIEAMRNQDRSLSLEWRYALREALEMLLASGYEYRQFSQGAYTFQPRG